MRKDADHGSGLWPLITRPGAPLSRKAAAELRPLAERFAHLVRPPMAAHLLGAAAEKFGIEEFAPGELRKFILRNRLRRHQGLRWAAFIAGAGVEVVYLKGFAAAHDIYPDPELRTMSDIDILVREGDLTRLVAALAGEGFTFRRPDAIPAWGLITDASFAPFVSRDEVTNIDIHVRPDDFPVHRALSTEKVFAESREVGTDAARLRIPRRDHLLLLAITSAARDKFASIGLKSLIDALLIVIRHGGETDWAEIESLAREGGFLKPVGAFLALAEGLGVPGEGLPRRLMPRFGPLAAAEFRRLVADYAAMLPEAPTTFTEVRRELLLTAEPHVIAWKYRRRLKGLLFPRMGVPKTARRRS